MRRLTLGGGTGALTRLTRVHAVSTAADACITVALAGSLFFNVDPDVARSRLACYLVLTLAPFAVASVMIGAVAGRFLGVGPRILAFTGHGRALFAVLLALDPTGLVLYPASFAVLVLGRTYAAVKRALVPGAVAHPDLLVHANARLSRAGSLAGLVGGGLGMIALQLGPALTLQLAAGLHVVGAALAIRCLNHSTERAGVAVPIARNEGAPLTVALATTAALRAATGLLWFVLAFELRDGGTPRLVTALVAIAIPVGSFAGTFVSPRLRRVLASEHAILVTCTAIAAASAFVAAALRGPGAMIGIAVTLALASSIARHALDSLVQRTTSDPERSRVVARSEAVLQLAWVAGALVAIGVGMASASAYGLITVLLGATLAAAAIGRRRPRVTRSTSVALAPALRSWRRSIIRSGHAA
ncbi:MAG: hypothetical protein ACT4OX_11045 [Actinomycetota bacterium]